MKTHVFGCSLSHGIDWPEDFVVHAVEAGDNTTMCRRYQDIFFSDLSSSDNILWEVTYPNRLGFRLEPTHHFYESNSNNKDMWFHTALPNILDKQSHIDYVNFNKDWYETYYFCANINQELQNLLYHIVSASKNNFVYVWFAQADLMDVELLENFLSVLEKHNIKYLHPNKGIMTWAKENAYPFAPDGHPTKLAYDTYRDKYLIPYVK